MRAAGRTGRDAQEGVGADGDEDEREGERADERCPPELIERA